MSSNRRTLYNGEHFAAIYCCPACQLVPKFIPCDTSMPWAEDPGDLVFQVVVDEQRLVCIYMTFSDFRHVDSESDTTMTCLKSWCLTYESAKMIAFISDCVRESTSSMASTFSPTITLQWETELLHKQLPALHPRWHSYDGLLSILCRITTASIWNLSIW